MLDQTNTYNDNTTFKKRLLLLFFIGVMSISLLGCSTSGISRSSTNSLTGGKLINSAVEIQESGSAIRDSATRIQESADIIEGQSEALRELPELASAVDDIQRETGNITNETSRIVQEVDKLEEESRMISSTGRTVEDLEADLQEAQEEESKEARKKLYTLLTSMAAFGGLIVIGGIALAFFNPKLGAYLIGFGLLITTIAVAGTYYLKWIAIIGFVLLGIGLIVTLIFLVHSFYKAKIYKDSHESSVELLENVKEELPEEKKDLIFGDEGLASQIQPKKVRKEIQRTRNRLHKKSEIQEDSEENLYIDEESDLVE